MRSVRARWTATAVAVSVLVGLALWLRSADLSVPPRFLPRCAFFEVTGRYCPGCGNTRAAHALLHGDVVGAFGQNAFTVLALPFLALFAWRAWRVWIAPGRPVEKTWKPRQWQVVTVVTAFFAFTFLRNLPWEPFRWLAPDPPKVRESPASAAPATPSRDAPPPAAR